MLVQLAKLCIHLKVQKQPLLLPARRQAQTVLQQPVHTQQWERIVCLSPACCLERAERKAGHVGTGAPKLPGHCQGTKNNNNFCWQEQGWGGGCWPPALAAGGKI